MTTAWSVLGPNSIEKPASFSAHSESRLLKSAKILGDVNVVTGTDFDPDSCFSPVGREYVFSVPCAVHPSIHCSQRNLLCGIPVVIGDAVLCCCRIIEATEGDILGSGMHVLTDPDSAGKSVLSVAVGKSFPLGGVVTEVISVGHVVTVFRRDPRQGIVPVQRLKVMFTADLVDLCVNPFGKIGGLNRGLRLLLPRADIAKRGAENKESRE